jgi:hypothetical protein
MRRVVFAALVLVLAAGLVRAANGPKAEEETQRAAAIAEFTKKMRDANYPTLFDAAAVEFRVPADILKGIAFAETRWEHLTWPPGETRSPDTGMPRPYGIMSLWDNEFFGHSLIEAAQLIGKNPEELKNDPFQNIRGGAALLRKIYDETRKPEGTAEADIESWRYAIRKYCGIPEPDLNAQHALDVYTFISKGYNQYGIEWRRRSVNLEPIIAETRNILKEERAKRELAHDQQTQPQENPISRRAEKIEKGQPVATKSPQIAVSTVESPTTPERTSNQIWWWFILGLLIPVGVTAMIFRHKGAGPTK